MRQHCGFNPHPGHIQECINKCIICGTTNWYPHPPSLSFNFSETNQLINQSHCQVYRHLDFLLFYFLVLHFTLIPVINFDFIFIKSVRTVSRFTFCIYWMSSCYTSHWKDSLVSTELPLLLCQISVAYMYLDIFWDFLFCPIDLFVYSWNCRFIVSLKVW